VYGFGEHKTPKPFISACDKFIYTEILTCKEAEGAVDKRPKRMSTNDLKGDTTLVNMLRAAVEATMDETGWAFLGSVGQHIANQASEFDPRNFGYTKLMEIIKEIKLFDMSERPSEKAPNIKHIYVKDKRYKPSE
jgi:hypothetical protein